MKTILTGITCLVFISTFMLRDAACQVAINIDGSIPNTSAMLDVKSTTKGFLLPRMTTGQRIAVTGPVDGLMVYDTDVKDIFIYRNGAWNQSLSSGSGWRLTGNTGTVAGTNFIGTTDNIALSFKVNNLVSGKIDPALFNTSLGYQSLLSISTGSNNTALGAYALYTTGSGSGNSALGKDALFYNTDGSSNTAVGAYALSLNVSGASNTATGYSALNQNKGNQNSAVGCQALSSNSTGNYNTAAGYQALYQNTTSYNTAFGCQAMSANTTGFYNTAAGMYALKNNTAGNRNVAIGAYTLYLQNYNPGFATDFDNVAIGNYALYSNQPVSTTTGVRNTAIGINCLYANTEGFQNTAIGCLALSNNTLGDDNTASGYNALLNNTEGNSNTATGNQALRNNTKANNNIAIGESALYTQSFNPCCPWNSENVAVGHEALYSNEPTSTSNGINNTAIGNLALRSNMTGASNTATGYCAARFSTTGWQNTAVGANSMLSNNLGSYNTAIGYNTGPNSNNYSNTTCLGIDATATGGDMVRIGNVYVGSIGGYQNWTNISDERFKEDIREDVPGLLFITQLRPVTYRVNREKINEFSGVNDRRNRIREQEADAAFQSGDQLSAVITGFLAQEVEMAAKKIGFDFSGVDAPKNGNDMYGLRYAEFVVPLVKAVQEQQAAIGELKAQNAALLKRIEALEKK